MSSLVPSRGALPSFARVVRRLLLAAVVLSPMALVLLVVETEPRVADWIPPDGSSAEQARGVAERLRDLVSDGGAAGGWSATEAEMNGVLASAERLLPGVRGRAEVGAEALALDVSVGAPLVPAGLWANLHLAFAASEQRLEVASARIGRLPLPPPLAERALRLGLDRVLGDGFGAMAVDSVAALWLAPGEARVLFHSDADGRVALFERLRERARGVAGSEARELAAGQLWSLDEAVRERRLPRQGSVLPYLRFVVETARAQKGPEAERARGALYALALYCGDPAFEAVVGVWLPSRMSGAGNGCTGTTLGGRDDLRKHFVIAAGLDAATSSTAAFGMGELKELIDSNAGGSGFSFEDMAADAAGVRFSRTLLAAPSAAWAELQAGIAAENDVLPPLADLPSGLSGETFRQTFGAVDSDAYAAIVAEIDRRVGALPLHAPASGGRGQPGVADGG